MSMKKVYSKPEIMFEDFSLSTNIAGDCEEKTKLLSRNEYGCGYPLRNGKVVFTDEYGCTTTPDDGPNNNLCYHVPEGSYNLFNS